MKIKIYSAQTCPNCQAAKNFFQSKGLNYQNIDINSNPEAKKELEKKGLRSVPIIEINGETIMGFDEKKILNQLNKKE